MRVNIKTETEVAQSAIFQGFKKLSKQTFIYGAGVAITQLAAFVLIPVFTHVFSPVEYGVIDAISVFFSFAALFLMMGLDSATQRFYFDSNDKKERLRVINTAFWFLVLISIVVCSLLFIFSSSISSLIFKTKEYSFVFKIGILSIPFALLSEFLKGILRIKFAPWRYNFASFANFFIRVGLSIYLVSILRYGIIGNFYGILAGASIALILTLFFVKNDLKFRFSYFYLKNMLKFGLPLVLTGLGFWALLSLNRFFFIRFSTLEELGLYSVGSRISNFLLLFIFIFQLSWSPFIMSIYKSNYFPRLMAKTLIYFVILIAFLALVVSAFSYEIIKIITPLAYIDSYKVIGILAIGIIFYAATPIVGSGISLSKKTYFFSISVFCAALLSVILNALLIPHFGMLGAAFGVSASYFVLVLLYYIFAQKCWPINYEPWKVIKIIFLCCVLIGLSYLINTGNFLYNVLLKLVIVFSFPISIFFLRIFTRQELDLFKFYLIKSKDVIVNRLKI